MIQDLTPSLSRSPSYTERVSYASSESSWSGKHGGTRILRIRSSYTINCIILAIPSDAGFTASSEGSEAPSESEADIYDSEQELGPVYRPMMHLQRRAIGYWAETVRLPSTEPPSPTSTDCTEWSEFTAGAGGSVANVDVPYRGDWMSLPLDQRVESFRLAE